MLGGEFFTDGWCYYVVAGESAGAGENAGELEEGEECENKADRRQGISRVMEMAAKFSAEKASFIAAKKEFDELKPTLVDIVRKWNTYHCPGPERCKRFHLGGEGTPKVYRSALAAFMSSRMFGDQELLVRTIGADIMRGAEKHLEDDHFFPNW